MIIYLIIIFVSRRFNKILVISDIPKFYINNARLHSVDIKPRFKTNWHSKYKEEMYCTLFHRLGTTKQRNEITEIYYFQNDRSLAQTIRFINAHDAQ